MMQATLNVSSKASSSCLADRRMGALALVDMAIIM